MNNTLKLFGPPIAVLVAGIIFTISGLVTGNVVMSWVGLVLCSIEIVILILLLRAYKDK